MSKILRTLMYVVLMGAAVFCVSSCEDDNNPANSGSGTITGLVTDDVGQPLSDVNVTVSGIKEEDISVTTGADGRYTVENVSLKTHAITFSKAGWLTISVTVTADKFDTDKVATANASMVSASSKIVGVIADAKNGGAPLAGATVTVGVAGTATSAADGTYAIENLVVDEYTVTFSKTDYVSVTRTITEDDFVDGVVTLNVTLGGSEVLRGLTVDDLATADKWYYNEYRGGGNADAYPHWDWACDYMSSLKFWGNWEEQWEGTTLRIRNDEGQRANPADLTMFDSYVYGSKLITEDNKILSLRLRTHNADAVAPAYFGVQVVDLSAPEPTAVKVGEDKTYGSGDYADFEFDLSAYVGKEVVIAIGIYRQSTGDYWKQLVLRAIRFADRKVENWDWLPGTEVVPGWKLTQETVRSTMPHIKKSFTGISPISAGRDVNMATGYPAAYQAWRAVAHVGAEWHFVPLKKDPEVFAGEGYIIKTRNTPEVSTEIPEAYIYAKFTIAAGSNQLTLKTRNFQSGSAPDHYTYFKLTAIQDDGTVTHVEPTSNTAEDASAADNGSWKFRHYFGTKDDPDSYASFVYDLSQFNGSNVVLVFGVYNGAANTSENKLAFYSINMN
ncbi:MAG TPA: carboxypeptidase-like regulatory domain-containing protein [Ohtaekwangia sp.]|nr:carboxypeptidase-like regulatory domain-containing protein [Ohtaekwangia sp.]